MRGLNRGFNKVLITFAVSGAITALSMNSYADRVQPYHLCFQPEKPLLLASRYQVELYKKDISAYEQCIDKFIINQDKEIVMHQNAIKAAKKERKLFVKQHKQ